MLKAKHDLKQNKTKTTCRTQNTAKMAGSLSFESTLTTQQNMVNSVEEARAQKLLINNNHEIWCVYLKSTGISRSITDFLNIQVFSWFNALRLEAVLHTFKSEPKFMGRTVTMLTEALNCDNKGPLVSGRSIKPQRCMGVGLAEQDPFCVLRYLLYFDAIFLNEWKAEG